MQFYIESSPLVLGLINFKGKNSVFVLGNVCDARNVLALLYISVGETIQMVLCIMWINSYGCS